MAISELVRSLDAKIECKPVIELAKIGGVFAFIASFGSLTVVNVLNPDYVPVVTKIATYEVSNQFLSNIILSSIYAAASAGAFAAGGVLYKSYRYFFYKERG